jgi:hypothetical protein
MVAVIVRHWLTNLMPHERKDTTGKRTFMPRVYLDFWLSATVEIDELGQWEDDGGK